MQAAAAIDPRFVDIALALIALEAVALLAWRWSSGRGPEPRALVANLLAGASLLVAARGALTGASSLSIGAALAAALVAHIFDLAGRWRTDVGESARRSSLGPQASTHKRAS